MSPVYSDIFFNYVKNCLQQMFFTTLHINFKFYNLIPWILIFKMKQNRLITLTSSKATSI